MSAAYLPTKPDLVQSRLLLQFTGRIYVLCIGEYFQPTDSRSRGHVEHVRICSLDHVFSRTLQLVVSLLQQVAMLDCANTGCHSDDLFLGLDGRGDNGHFNYLRDHMHDRVHRT
jgi:hypothetical protein